MADFEGTALGLVETRGLVAALEAADAMLKAANVRLLTREQTVPALITIEIVGEVAAVRASVEAGRRAAERVGEVVAVHVIPRPDASVRAMLAAQPPNPKPSAEALEERTVKELRAMAREIEDLPLQGREIARANKQQLIEVLRAHS